MTRTRPIIVGLLLLAGCLSASGSDETPQSAEELYLRLRSVGLDPARVYQVRGANLDRPGLHITFDDGTIAFTHEIHGQVTGVFFEGEGEVLVVPPDRAERASLGLFTKAAILEEKFVTAYLRFNDNTIQELQPFLRSAEDPQAFFNKWAESSERLADNDALRLLLSMSRFLPPADPSAPATDPEDRFLHGHFQGTNLGVFDLGYDTSLTESVWAGQTTVTGGFAFYDQWLAFRPRGVTGRDPAAGDVIEIRSYRIRSRISPPTTLHAEADLDASVTTGGQRALFFELSRALKIERVEVDGEAVEFVHNPSLEGTQLARRGNDLVAVVFRRPLHAGQKLLLHFVYEGDVLAEAGKGLLYVGARGTWYPNRGFAMADFDLDFRYPAEWTLLATGSKVESGATDDPAEVRTRWRTDRPIPVAGFNLGKYASASTSAGQVTVESYATTGVERSFPKGRPETVTVPTIRPREQIEEQVLTLPPPPSPARNARAVADKAAEALEFYADRFGPYPYKSLRLTQMPGTMSQGWPGLIFLSTFGFLSPEERAQLNLNRVEALLDGQLIAHETAHQWWGDLVLWKSYRDQWIFEGLSNYCALMLLEKDDPAAFRVVMDHYRHDLLLKNKDGNELREAGPVTLGLRLSSSHFPHGYEAISYGRGTWLFHMLRHMLNDGRAADPSAEEPFVRALRRLREQMEGKVVTTARVLQAFEPEARRPLWFEGKKSLDWFLDSWINGISIPQIELKGVKLQKRKGSVTVTGSISQKNAADDLVTSIPLYAAMPGKKLVFIGRVFADGAESSFRLSAPADTERIVVDPNDTVLSRHN